MSVGSGGGGGIDRWLGPDRSDSVGLGYETGSAALFVHAGHAAAREKINSKNSKIKTEQFYESESVAPTQLILTMTTGGAMSRTTETETMRPLRRGKKKRSISDSIGDNYY